MNKTRRYLLVALPLVPTAWWTLGWWNRRSAVLAALDWARLAPLPHNATNVEVQVLGGMFTRTFKVTFTSSASERDTWLERSPGISDAERTVVGDSTHYEILPGAGAVRTYVRVDENVGSVIIFAQWS